MRRKISRLDSVVMLLNVWVCEDNDNHADMTFEELVKAINKGGLMDDDLIQSCLYCCNMNDENEYIGFHHPFDVSLNKWIPKVIGDDYKFDYTYNLVRPRGPEGD